MATICGETSNEAIQLQTLKKILPPRNLMSEANPFGICFVDVDGQNERMQNKKSWENKAEAGLVRSFLN